jgi:hypothetical protein
VFITRGSRVSVSHLSISIGPDGTMETDLRLHLSLDMCPYWLRWASAHVAEATARHASVVAAWQGPDGEPRHSAIEAEFETSTEAVVAAAIALDAFYARVKEFVNLPPELIARWQANGTARYKQVAEVLRRAFRMDARSTVDLRNAIREVFRFRDLAVHPPADARAPVRYAELNTNTEWRLEAFRAENARVLCGLAISVVAQLVEAPRLADPPFIEYCAAARNSVEPILASWEARHGRLFPRRSAAPPAV